MNRRFLTDALVFVLLVVLGISSRLLQDVTPLLPPNFHAIVAVTMFAGYYFKHWSAALGVPVAAMIVSDVVIGGYDGGVMVTVYSALAMPVLWRTFLRRSLSPGRLGISSLVSSTVFYVSTNFAVWYCWSASGSWESLTRCYTVALPFFGYTLAGDAMYSTAVFGAYVLVKRFAFAAQRSSAEALSLQAA